MYGTIVTQLRAAADSFEHGFTQTGVQLVEEALHSINIELLGQRVCPGEPVLYATGEHSAPAEEVIPARLRAKWARRLHEEGVG